jgi:hypothetical protein
MVAMLKTVLGELLCPPEVDRSLRSRMLADTQRFLNQRLPRSAWPTRPAARRTKTALDRANPCGRLVSRRPASTDWK